MKDKKIISYKSERVKKFAYNLRSLINEVVMDEWNHLGEEQERIRLESKHEVSKRGLDSLNDQLELSRLKNKASVKYRNIENKRSDLYRALKASICYCPSCNQTNRDMVYNAPLKEWFCMPCVQEYRDFYLNKKAIFGDLTEDGDFYETFF